ncbi:MurR/RpiR family transcriptional regulator [Serinicoccus kebangsaanensis]|uniref:MurR/RpiR family transcriptional regulator n=1 Tax=Serinicoccus kebangsaanensis TaxID=2602069 RepID=UPI00124E73A1|nr:MurR/RpiR family transcriptional regulator [Serinicoccus kebangsaanensis]
MSTDLPDWITSRLGERSASRGVRKVLGLVVTHQRQLAYASTAKAAELAGVNPATVVRAAQQVGYTGWPAMRMEVRARYLSQLSASEVLHEHADEPGDGLGRAAVRRDLHNLQDLAGLLDDDQLRRVAGILIEARVTLVLGSGSFAAPGLQLAHLAQTLGHDVRLERAGGTALLNSVRLLRPGDALVLFDLWHTPQDLVRIAGLTGEHRVRLVVIADSVRPGVADAADELVLVPSEGASMFPSLVPAVTAVQAIIAAVVEADRRAASAAADAADRLWHDFGLFPDEHARWRE